MVAEIQIAFFFHKKKNNNQHVSLDFYFYNIVLHEYITLSRIVKNVYNDCWAR